MVWHGCLLIGMYSQIVGRTVEGENILLHTRHTFGASPGERGVEMVTRFMDSNARYAD